MNWTQIEAELRHLGSHPEKLVPRGFSARVRRAAAASLLDATPDRTLTPTNEVAQLMAWSSDSEVCPLVLGQAKRE